MLHHYVDASLDDNLVSAVYSLLLIRRLLNVERMMVLSQICCICRLDHHCIEARYREG
jgi:hypothetical protein